jgi:hypothetical protein
LLGKNARRKCRCGRNQWKYIPIHAKSLPTKNVAAMIAAGGAAMQMAQHLA